MWTSDKNRWTSSFKYVEIGVYKDEEHPLSRLKNKDGSPYLIPVNELDEVRKKYKNTGIYTSIYQYDSADYDPEKPYIGNLYFDLDNKANPEQARLDMRKLMYYIREFVPEHAVNAYYSGLKGFHIEVEAYCLGVPPSTNLAQVYKKIASSVAEELSITLDMQVYDTRRMWRLVDSVHQATGLYKTRLDWDMLDCDIEHIKRYCAEPKPWTIGLQQFNPKANQWFREFVYQVEKESNPEDPWARLQRFNSNGISIFSGADLENAEFDPIALFNNCHAITDLWRQAEEKGDLSHEARLFLCSILSYTPEAIEYLLAILKNCDDYNESKSRAHIQDWIRRRELGIGGRPLTCVKANDWGVGCGDCHLEKRSKFIKVGSKMIQTEEESEPSAVRFAYRYKKD